MQNQDLTQYKVTLVPTTGLRPMRVVYVPARNQVAAATAAERACPGWIAVRIGVREEAGR